MYRARGVLGVTFVLLAGVFSACAVGTDTEFDSLEPTDQSNSKKDASTSKVDSGAKSDAGGSDTGKADTGSADTGPADSSVDTGKPDAANTDSGKSDSGTIDSGTVDSGIVDSGTVDSGTCTTVGPNNVCGLVPQCGCGPKQTCDVTNYTTGAATCTTSGTSPMGDYCATTADCAMGLTCVGGACRPYCSTAGSACAGNGVGDCVQLVNSSNQNIPNAKVCTVTCSLMNPSTACGSNNCTYWQDVKKTDCVEAGSALEYDDCSLDYCGKGLVCVHDSIFDTCMKWCRVGYNTDCGLFQTCQNLLGSNAPVVNGTTYGVCDY